MNCGCTHSCRLHLERRADGPFPECDPAIARYFTICRTTFVRGADGEPEKEHEFFPRRYASLEEALRKLSVMPWGSYCIDDTPRMGFAPAFMGWPEKAKEKLVEVSGEQLASV